MILRPDIHRAETGNDDWAYWLAELAFRDVPTDATPINFAWERLTDGSRPLPPTLVEPEFRLLTIEEAMEAHGRPQRR